jgi:hypothetical protein
VIIDKAPPADLAAECARHGIAVLTGDCRELRVLEQARVPWAAELVVLTDEDSTNFEVARQARALLRAAGNRRSPLACDIHLSSVELRVELQKAAVLAPQAEHITVRYFDLFDREARQLLRSTWPLDGEGIRVDETRRVHLVILGFGRMGRALAVRAAKMGHFANATRDPLLKLSISVIDRDADRLESEFLAHYPRFREASNLEFVAEALDEPTAREKLTAWLDDPACLTRVAICFDDESRVMTTALQLRPRLAPRRIPLAVRLASPAALEQLIGAGGGGPADAWIRAFGTVDESTVDDAFDEDPTERLAEEIHRAHRANQLAGGRSEDEASLQPWARLAEPFRESNRQQADQIDIKLRAFGYQGVPQRDPRPGIDRFDEAEIDVMARMEHDRWNAERWLEGWSYAPPPKNESLRTSPHLVPWKDLAPSIQEWDRAAVRAIPGHLQRVGRKVCKAR